MLNIAYTRQFKRDVKKLKKRNKDITKLRPIIDTLIKKKPLSEKQRDHLLVGNYKNRRECHVEPDWLLIYKVSKDEIIFERTGSHSDLFK